MPVDETLTRVADDLAAGRTGSRPAATPWRDRLGAAGCFLVVAVLLALVVVGAVTVVRAVLG